MILSTKMITGFNTNVQHDGRVYHVQTEDRGRENPVFESLVYVEGTVVAKKLTHYADQLKQGATEEALASLLKKQHQVMIAAIKAGRIEDLIRHYAKEQNSPDNHPPKSSKLKPEQPVAPAASRVKHAKDSKSGALPANPAKTIPPAPNAPPAVKPAGASGPVRNGKTGSLDLDEVISDYLKRSSEQDKLDLEVLTPEVFMAGKNINLKVKISQRTRPAIDAIVTVKIIGTAFKPQVYIGRAGRDGVASFNLALPSFTAGTAAIVIEAQSNQGRGELKHLIRRA